MPGLKLKTVGAAGLRHIYRHIRRDFHSYERIPLAAMLLSQRRGAQECHCVVDESGHICGYAVCCVSSLYGYVLLNYFAISPFMRGSGVGSEVMRLLTEKYKDKQGIIIELTDTPNEKRNMERRRRFYTRNGFIDVPCNYLLAGARMQLMVCPIRGTWDIKNASHLIIPEIYSHIFPMFVLSRIVKIKKWEAK